jgi:hypothetical protein
METTELEAYVRAALAIQGYRFDESHVNRIADIVLQFSRFAAMADIVNSTDLPLDAEGAAVFRP